MPADPAPSDDSPDIDAFIARIAALPPTERMDVARLLLWGLIIDILDACRDARIRREGLA